MFLYAPELSPLQGCKNAWIFLTPDMPTQIFPNVLLRLQIFDTHFEAVYANSVRVISNPRVISTLYELVSISKSLYQLCRVSIYSQELLPILYEMITTTHSLKVVNHSLRVNSHSLVLVPNI